MKCFSTHTHTRYWEAEPKSKEQQAAKSQAFKTARSTFHFFNSARRPVYLMPCKHTVCARCYETMLEAKGHSDRWATAVPTGAEEEPPKEKEDPRCPKCDKLLVDAATCGFQMEALKDVFKYQVSTHLHTS